MTHVLRACLLFLLLIPYIPVNAEVITRPFLIDANLVPREAVTETIKLSSSYEARKAILFATVNEITVGTDGEIKEFVSPVMTDRTNTITSWIEIQRGRIEVPAGEEVEIPLTVTAHPYAKPGEYHAFIGFVEAKKRYQAEEVAMAGDADGVLLKVTIEDERVDSMRISAVQVDRVITDPETQEVYITIENQGDLASAPTGELIFYNSRGIEVAATPVNQEARVVAAGDSRTFAVSVPFSDNLGRFKANVALQYGENQQASLFDTATFFMIPTWYLVLFCVGLLLLILVFGILFKRALHATPVSEHGDDVVMFVRDGHDENPQTHDIDLSQTKE